MNDWHTAPEAGPIRASNPCSEYMFLDDTACNLASLNLLAYGKAEGTFDIEAYAHSVRLWTIVVEISVMMAQFPSKEIAQLSYKYLARSASASPTLAAADDRRIPYDSDEGAPFGGADRGHDGVA